MVLDAILIMCPPYLYPRHLCDCTTLDAVGVACVLVSESELAGCAYCTGPYFATVSSCARLGRCMFCECLRLVALHALYCPIIPNLGRRVQPPLRQIYALCVWSVEMRHIHVRVSNVYLFDDCNAWRSSRGWLDRGGQHCAIVPNGRIVVFAP